MLVPVLGWREELVTLSTGAKGNLTSFVLKKKLSPLRSLVAGIVDQTELGAVYGLLAIMDAILPFICEISKKESLNISTLHFSLSHLN